jgi:glycosyltransferase involved in cell wall biosynthesis
MLVPFKLDPFPGEPKVLFLGDVHGSHARSWMSIAQDAGINVRAFGFANGVIPRNMEIPSYSPLPQTPQGPWHRPVLTNHWVVNTLLRSWDDMHGQRLVRRSLRKVLAKWQPDVVHTLGVFPASENFLSMVDTLDANQAPFWVVQARGGPDIEVNRWLEERRLVLGRILARCDGFIADTDENLAAAVELGLDPAKRSSIGRVPGGGGIDVDRLQSFARRPASRRSRILIVPKAYEHIQGKLLPVLEGLKLCWDRLGIERVIFTATNDEVLPWIRQLPSAIRDKAEIHGRAPHEQLLGLLGDARCMLAPSLLDGIPNVMMEAMAAGVVPIVSPIPTIASQVKDPENVFFARNLYPHEIADALVRAFSGEDIDAMAERNLALVKTIGAKSLFVDRIAQYYRSIANRRPSIA